MIRSSRSESGVTLVELVVSMLVLTVALLIANGLLIEAVRIFSASGRELREPASELALRLLREDVRASSPLPAGSGGPGPLNCRRADRTDRWELVGDRLMRRGLPSALVWVLRDNPSRFFYERLGGKAVATRPISVGGIDVDAVAYGWRDLAAVLEAQSTAGY